MVLTHLQHWHFIAVVFNILFYLDIFSFFPPLRIGLFIKILTALLAGLHADLVHLLIVAVSLVSVAVTWILVHAAWRRENTSISTNIVSLMIKRMSGSVAQVRKKMNQTHR